MPLLPPSGFPSAPVVWAVTDVALSGDAAAPRRVVSNLYDTREDALRFLREREGVYAREGLDEGRPPRSPRAEVVARSGVPVRAWASGDRGAGRGVGRGS